MIAITTCYLIASAAALKVAALSFERDRRHAVQIAGVIMLACGCYNSTWLTHNWWFWAPMDATTAWFVAIRCRSDFRRWKLVIVLALTAQVLCHARWQIGDKFGGSAYVYHFALNRLFEVQLFAVASSGICRVWGAICDYVAGGVGSGRGWRVDLLRRGQRVRSGER